MNDIVDLGEYRGRRRAGLFTLADLPVRDSVESIALGCGWPELDGIWKIYPGQFTVATGIAGHGKSTFLLNVVCRLARQHGLRSLLYVPENEMHLRDKMRRIWNSDEASFKEFCERCFIQSSSPDNYAGEAQDLPWLLDKAAGVIDFTGIDLLLIDPWNEIEHLKPRDLSMTDYIRDALMFIKTFARKSGIAVILVVHPTKAVFDNGKARVPSLADCEGSMSWYNKADNGLIIYRDLEAQNTRVISAKVRERGAGHVGVCYFMFDELTENYTPLPRVP